MPKLLNLEIDHDYTFNENHTIDCLHSSMRDDFTLLFEAIEAYITDLGGSYKWVSDSLTVYPKAWKDINKARMTESAWTVFIDIFEEGFDEGAEVKVSFACDIEDEISNFKDVKKALKNIVNATFPADYYYTEEENKIREAKHTIAKADQKERDDMNKIFEEKLKSLRITRSEFEDALKFYK